MSAIREHHKALARNLVEIMGPDNALHVAIQYSWYCVAEEIARERRGCQSAVTS